MTDKNHDPVTEGARCRFYAGRHGEWREGVVRKVAENGTFIGHALVDDGDPSNPDIATNGFSVTAWVEPWGIEVCGEHRREEEKP